MEIRKTPLAMQILTLFPSYCRKRQNKKTQGKNKKNKEIRINNVISEG